ncbi:cytochrome P450 4C1-like [Diorhabda carinulata]|uniref:cytochrome P450 4C1-like n=1 Tax=Diorhabda carinulata TaxID=1163345 RepID=UPI0025A2AA0D|nr:cytochrome P450 4C1-like [Diorhabda carinulata]
MMIILLIITAVVIITMIAQFYWSKRHIYRAVANMEGPKGLPIIGNALEFFCATEDIHDRLKIIFANVRQNPMRIWLGTHLLIALKNPVHLEKIMSSQKFSYKHELYKFLESLSLDGLVAASGLNPKYRVHRRIIQPMIDIKFVKSVLHILNEQSQNCMTKMEKFIDGDNFDVVKVIGPCSVVIMCEILLGRKLDMESANHKHICHSIPRLLHIGITRMLKIWLHPDFIYNWHPLKKEQDKTLETLHKFINEVL